MAMSHGETEWSQVSEPFSTPESRAIGFGLEKPYNANQGRDGSWWFSKCVANCDQVGSETYLGCRVSQPSAVAGRPLELDSRI
jgi:hypothetical protein